MSHRLCRANSDTYLPFYHILKPEQILAELQTTKIGKITEILPKSRYIGAAANQCTQKPTTDKLVKFLQEHKKSERKNSYFCLPQILIV